MTMHHRIAAANTLEARRVSMDVRRQSADVSGRLSIESRQRQGSMLPAYSDIVNWPVDEEAGGVQHPHVQSSSRPSTPLLGQAPQRSSHSLPDLKRPTEFQCHTPCGAAASKRSPFAHPHLQHGSSKMQFGGAAKAATLLVMLVVCCLGVFSASHAAGSVAPLVRRQLAVSVISVKQQQPFSLPAAASVQGLAEAQGSNGEKCKKGFYLSTAGCTECPAGLTTRASGATSISECVAQAGSYLVVTAGAPRSRLCPRGSYSTAFNKLRSCLKCPKGQTTKKTGSTSKSACVARSNSGGRPYVDTGRPYLDTDVPTNGETVDDVSSSPSPSPTAAVESPSPSPSPSPEVDIPIDSEGLGGLDEPQIEDPPLPPVFLASPSPALPDVTATELHPAAVESSPSPSPSPRIIDLTGIQVVAQPIGLDGP